MSAAEEDRTKEAATVLNKVATAAYPAVGLAPWMSHYDKKTEAAIVLIKTIADGAEELDRQVWMLDHPEVTLPPEESKETEKDGEETEDEEIFDISRQSGGAYMFGYCLNRLASNIHNYAPSIDGIRTKQAIALAKANNPGVASQPEQQKRSLFEKITGRGKEKEKQ